MMMMMRNLHRTKSTVVDGLHKLRFLKGGVNICISRSFSETAALAIPPPPPCSSNVVDRGRLSRETFYPKKGCICSSYVFHPKNINVYDLYLDMLKKMTQQDPLPCVDDFTQVVIQLIVNDDVYYKNTCGSYMSSFLVGLVFESRVHDACLFLNKLIDGKLFQPTTLMFNTVIIALCDNPKKNTMDDAFKLFQQMEEPDAITYNSLVSGLCKIPSCWTKAYFLLKDLLDKDQGISPHVETFNILINAICFKGRLQVAAYVIYMMHQRGISPNVATYNTLIDAHCVKGEMDKVRWLVKYMVSNRIAPDTTTYTSLLDGCCNDYDKMDEANDYCKDDKKMDVAMHIYRKMNKIGFKPNCVNYERMIQSCFSAKRFEDALKLVRDMLAQGQTLDTYTYREILYDLLKVGYLEEALSLYDLFGEDSKLNTDTSVLEVLLDGVCGCGELDFARELFEGLSARGIKPTTGMYDSMIGGFCEGGLLNDAKRLFLEMEEKHCWPTTDICNYLLGVFMENKCYDDVKELLYKMNRQKHYLSKDTLSMLRASVAAGSLDATLLTVIKKLMR